MTAQVIENPSWRDEKFVYKDRQEAGRVLADYLAPYCDISPLVLAIPSGGVPIGLAIARRLRIDFDLLIIRKIPVPGETESGFGAISLEGDMLLNGELVRQLGLDRQAIEQLKKPVEKELKERNRLFRQGRPMPDINGRTIILVDDGLASGLTMSVAAEIVRRRTPGRIIIASPTAPRSTILKLRDAAELIICPNIREGFYFAVAEAYERWYDIGRDEVIALLQSHINKSI